MLRSSWVLFVDIWFFRIDHVSNNGAKKRTLARSNGSDNADEFSFLDVEVKAFENEVFFYFFYIGSWVNWDKWFFKLFFEVIIFFTFTFFSFLFGIFFFFFFIETPMETRSFFDTDGRRVTFFILN
jgi:hypothetical protein